MKIADTACRTAGDDTGIDKNEWLVMGGCHGLWLLPRSQVAEYLYGQAGALGLSLLALGITLIVGM